MQIIKSLIRLALFICPAFTLAQSTYLDQGTKSYQFIDRLEIKQQQNTDLNFSTIKPYSRKAIVRQAEYLDSARLGYADSVTGQDKYRQWTDLNLTRVDEYNLHSLLMNNSEWVTGSKADFVSAKPIFNAFYKTKVNLLEVNTKDFFLAVNPVLQIQQAVEPGYDHAIFLNSRGVTARGMIANKIGFSTFVTDNQERGPQFFQSRINAFHAVPGVGFYKKFKTDGVDYFDARGYITFNATKYIDFQFGYDKNFIGNGYRSLFLSDYGNSNLFLKVNTRIWKLNYENLFMELMPQFIKNGDTLLDRKYAAMHHLSMNVTKWLNVGLFEGVIFGRRNRFDFQYLNPIIFLRHVEGTIGSPDNAVAGLDFKANLIHRIQLYGQLLLDEFQLKHITKNDGYWANKYGLQGGFKYIDAFGINNLDLQLETNRVRPYTYSHYDSVANYTHYNQPLAHPLGANFQEYIGIAKYQPAPKWYINARAIYYKQGLDSAGVNFGSDPLENYQTRPRDYGFKIGSGSEATCINTTLQIAYELRENLFIETSILYRNFKINGVAGVSNTSLVTFGIRWNVFKREYDY
ncbi:MAG: hypothetical protein H0W12_08535 [Chitinophagaceae bacterium]|nr:hypothetical protein [Chitinophagaceae bacterium]